MAERFLSKELEAEISQRVHRGQWHSADEFVRHSIKAADALLELQAAIAEGDAQIARGEFVDGEKFLDQLEQEIEQASTPETEG